MIEPDANMPSSENGSSGPVTEPIRIQPLASPVSTRADLTVARRIVVKVGSSSISGSNVAQIDPIVDALIAARQRGVDVVLVSSGAIATAIELMDLTGRPADLATQQAAAAVGQNVLMQRYQSSLDRYRVLAGQILLTAGDMENATHRSNAQRALERLLGLGIMPIVNENDTVATAEIRFGDNDRLAALVSVLVHADALVLLSDIDALYTKPPAEPGSTRIDLVAHDDDLSQVTFGTIGVAGVGTGGAATKVAAAKHASAAGIPTLLAEAAQVSEALSGAQLGTWFEAVPTA